MSKSVEGLKGQEREVGQELMKLPVKGRERVIEAVQADTWGFAPSLLQTFQPEIIYSTGLVSLNTYFFCQSAGQYHNDLGRMLDWSDTNLGCAGMLGSPLSFDRRELRIYPRKHDARFLRLVALSALQDWKGQSYGEVLRGGKVEFRELPMPVNRYNRERAEKVVKFINEQKLPCWAFETARHYSSTEAFMVKLIQDIPPGPMSSWPEGATDRLREMHQLYEECRGLELLCVLVGALNAPVE